MLYGTIERTCGVNPCWHIEVDGYRWQRFMDFSKTEAIKIYRKENGLTGKRIKWCDLSKKPEQTLVTAILHYNRLTV